MDDLYLPLILHSFNLQQMFVYEKRLETGKISVVLSCILMDRVFTSDMDK